MKYNRTLLAFVVVLTFTLTAGAQSTNLPLGNPSDATDAVTNKDNFLIVKKQYVLSFNNDKGGPNWVNWHLQASDIGTEERGDFHPDNSLPAGFKKLTKADYTNTGFDRGHVCNSKDRTNTRVNNDATFLMTNILPQSPDSNQGPWKRLEDFERTLAKAGNELYIIAGAFGSGGTGEIKVTKNKKIIKRIPVSATEIVDGEVTVPKTFWKVMLVIKKGNNDLNRINAETRTIAVCMANKQGTRSADWHKSITTIRNVEAATGYDFFSELPTAVQDAIEKRRDSSAVGPTTTNPCQ
jgi:endonuclease G